MGKTASRTNGKQRRTRATPKAARKAKAPARRAKASAKPAPKPPAKSKRTAGKRVASSKPKKSTPKPRLSLVPKAEPASPPKAAPKSKRLTKPEAASKPAAEKVGPAPKHRTKPLTPAEQHRAAYDSEVLSILRVEFDGEDVADSDAKIRRRLREKSLGEYDTKRVAILRRFKDQLQSELSSGPQSGHFTSAHGLYANPEDFDHARLIRDYTRSYPTLSPEAIAGFVPLAVYFYYLR